MHYNSIICVYSWLCINVILIFIVNIIQTEFVLHAATDSFPGKSSSVGAMTAAGQKKKKKMQFFRMMSRHSELSNTLFFTKYNEVKVTLNVIYSSS